MARNLNELFAWKNNANKKKCDDDSPEYWQKRAAKAADKAVKCATGISYNNPRSLVDDDIYTEAQQLVRGWVTEQRVYGANSDRETFMRVSCDESDSLRQPSVIEVHKEWEHLVHKLETKQGYRDEIETLLESEDGDNVKDNRLRTVIDNLHKKSFVKPSQLRLVDSPKQVDVGKRMDCRQEQVKKKREERLKEEEMRRINKLAEKEARSEAMNMLKEEKYLKEMAKKKEEELIQMEMQRIRVEIKCQREEENRERERVRETQRLSARQNTHSVKEVSNERCHDAENRFQIISDIVDRKFRNKNLMRLRRCFQLWRDEVVKRRIAMTQAAAWNDWQILRRVFRVWRRDSRLTIINRRIDFDQQRMRTQQRKETMALSFWKKTILKKCLIHWSLFVVDEKETRWFVKLEEMRKQKMANYIDILQEKAKENQKKLNLLSLEKLESEVKKSENTQNISSNQIGIETERLNPAFDKSKKCKTSCSSARSTSANKNIPHEAWQVTKKHANLPLDQLVDNPNKQFQDSLNFKALRPPKAVDNYVNRNAAQKELIKHQQSKLKEQELLINELVGGYLLRTVNNENQETKTHGNNTIELQLGIGNDDDKSPENQHISTEFIPKKSNKLVAQMEERAKERERIKNERLERQKRLDEEKRKMLAEQLVEQCKLEAEEKQKREQSLREKREKEKMADAHKKKQLQLEQEKNEKADKFHKSILLKRYGIGRWKQWMVMKQNYATMALDHYRKNLLRKILLAWQRDVKELKHQQNTMIRSFYSKVLLTRCFYRFRLYKERYQLMEQMADEHYRQALVRNMFMSWRLSNHRSQIRLDKLQVQSVKLYQANILKSCFAIWKQLPVAVRAERQREKRKETMRQKVASIIPDFKPVY